MVVSLENDPRAESALLHIARMLGAGRRVIVLLLSLLATRCGSQQQVRCPYPHSHVDLQSGSCVCDPGYAVNAAATECEPGFACPPHAHASDTSCRCDPGFEVDAAGTGCEPAGAPTDSSCPSHAHAARSGGCECDADYHVNAQGTACVEGAPTDATCPSHAHVAPDGICDCDEGFEINPAGDACEETCDATVMSTDTAGSVLPAAPHTVTIRGLDCHNAGNADYTLQDQLVNGRPYWSAPGGYNLYWGQLQSAGEPVWILDSQGTIDACLASARVPTVVAVVQSDDKFPPMDGSWRDRCSGAWVDSSIISTYVLSAANCAALARAALASATCADNLQGPDPADGVASCSLPCAELLLRERARCAVHPSAFDRLALLSICEQQVRASLATAPSSVVVAPLNFAENCFQTAYTQYELQAVPRSGKPYYRTADGTWNLYWVGGSLHTSFATWVIDDDLDTGFSALYVNSHSKSPPTGAWNWQQTCDHELTPVGVSVAPQFSKSWCTDSLAALAPELTAVCCLASNDPGCGLDGAVPTYCSIDCAALWEPFADQCEVTATNVGADIATFFSVACTSAAVALTVLAPTTFVLEESETTHFVFAATSGLRYEITAHSGPGDGITRPCARNEYDDPTFSRSQSGPGECDRLISSGVWSCSKDLLPNAHFAHYCDMSCGFSCTQDGVQELVVWILPPGASDTRQITSSITAMPDKSLGFTATSTGDHTAKFRAVSGSGPVTIEARAVGTAEFRAPQLIADGTGQPFSVRCRLQSCDFTYLGTQVYDGDGHGFDLRLDARAGVAYAVSVELLHGQPAADISLTFFYAGAAAGSAGFEPTLQGTMGTWSTTAAGSHALTEYTTCEADDMSCEYVTVGVHPGQAFPSFLVGTWVAPTSGPVLLHVKSNCDVPFFSDVNLPGCVFQADGDVGCQRTESGHDYSICSSQLSLTVTEGAYVVADSGIEGRRVLQTEGNSLHTVTETHAPTPVRGIAQRLDTIAVPRAAVEAKAAAMFEAIPPNLRSTTAPPTVDEMLVPGSSASDTLASMFTVKQQPRVSYPLEFGLCTGTTSTTTCLGSGRRMLQMQADSLHATIETHAPSPTEAAQAQRLLNTRLSGDPNSGAESDSLAATHIPGPVCGLGSTEIGCTQGGQTVVRSDVVLSRETVETVVRERFHAMPVEQRTMAEAPTMDDMLVGGSKANALLAATFLQKQQPLHISPAHSDSGGHRRMQAQGDDLHITVDSHAATPEEIDRGLHRLASSVGGRVISPGKGTGGCSKGSGGC